jgi:hypothetical protein
MLANAEHKINASTFVFAGTFHAIIWNNDTIICPEERFCREK